MFQVEKVDKYIIKSINNDLKHPKRNSIFFKINLISIRESCRMKPLESIATTITKSQSKSIKYNLIYTLFRNILYNNWL